MFSFLTNLHLDRLSFWLGFLAASLSWWALVRLVRLGRILRERLQAQLDEITRRRKAGLDERLRRETLRKVQSFHLAASLFPLEEIIILPQVFTPYQAINADGTIAPNEDLLRTPLPYTPDWPEINSNYGAPKLTLALALQGGVNLAVIGQPGSGKTFALAHLASQISRKETSAGSIANRLPLFIHVSDLRYPTDPAEMETSDPVSIITSAISSSSPLLLQPQIPGYIHQMFSKGQALIILDGADEMPLVYLKNLTHFINSVLTKYPGNQLVMSACADYLDGLISIGIRPVSLCSWTYQDRLKYVKKWSEQWQLHIEPAIARQMSREPLNCQILNNWLLVDRSFYTPLEFTLKVWSVYAGDPRGVKGFQGIESYLLRLVQDEKLYAAVCNLAFHVTLAGQTTFSRSHATHMMGSIEPMTPPASAVPTTSEQPSHPAEAKRSGAGQTPAQVDLSRLVNSGLLIERQNDCLAFSHPVIMGYLASQRPINANTLNEVMGQPTWIGKSVFLHYISTASDISPQIETLIRQDATDPFMRNLLMVSHWLSDAPANAPWRVQMMRRLVNALQKDTLPLSIRARIMAAFVSSNDSSLPQMFHQLLGSPSPVIRQLAALGCGAIQDLQSIRDLAGLMSDQFPDVRFAACMALVAMGASQAVDPVLDMLIKGDEELSQVAAEAFASQPEIGFNILKECAAFDNLLIRRAAVFGLAKVNETWATDLLKQMQIEDGQWVVRNAANEALEMLQKTNPIVPHPLQPIHNSPWLIKYASKQGVGIIPGNSATDLLLQALKTGTSDEKLAALDYLVQRPVEKELVNDLGQIVFKERGLMSEAAAYALWLLAMGGAAITLPVELQAS